jgi:hypothetical protein
MILWKNLISYVTKAHVRWVRCHHDMAHPHFADGGDGLQIWRVAVNILNKKLWTDDKMLSFSLGVGRAAKQLLTVKNKLVTKRSQEALDLDGFFG